MGMATKEQLLAVLRPELDEPAWGWLQAAVRQTDADDVDPLLTAYTAASRRIGSRPLSVVPGAGPSDLRLDRWTAEDAARAVLLLARAERSGGDDFLAAATACYEQADAREQQSWLRAVGVLPEPGRFLPLVIDACRSSVLPVFEAVACENPYPAHYFPERNFNQLVLKALFNGVALARVVGLARRLNPELARMAIDYAAERRAAGRSIPDDIALVTPDAGRSLSR
jgi:hypothetical protein